MPTLPILAFAVIALAVLAGMHHLFWLRVVRDLEWPRGLRRALTLLVILLGLGFVAAFVLARRFPAGAGGRWTLPLWLWLGFLFYALLILFGVDLGLWIAARRARARARRGGAELDAGRRLFLRRAAVGGGLAGAAGISWVGARSEERELTRPEVPVRLARLPRALSGLRVAQLSDVHLGPLHGERFARRIVQETLRTRPDLIVITGDLVDGSVAGLRSAVEPLFELRARFGVYFVSGNHEYYSGADEWLEYLAARGIRVLHNERVPIGDGGGSFDLVGIPDHSARALGAPRAPDLGLALSGRDPERETILLAHQPRQIADAAGQDLGLQLSGHTHGGQLWPFGALVLLAQPYLHGLHVHEGRTQIYVSRGTGSWGPPMRVGNPAEIADLILL